MNTTPVTKRELIKILYPELKLALEPVKSERSEYRANARDEWTPADMPHAEWIRILGKHN